MVELDNEKRAFFQKGKQKFFIFRIRKILNLSNEKLARILGISSRTVRDWQKEKFSMSLGAIKILCQKIKQPIPRDIKIKSRYWYVASGSSAGGLAVIKKYGYICGDPEYRKRKWREWWDKIGKFREHSIIGSFISIKKPDYSGDLAEFVGIVLGDGGLTRGQLVITLNCVDDLEYSNFVADLLFKLFGFLPSRKIRKNSKVILIRASRVDLTRFCQKIGLKLGNKIKQQVDIPDWIKNNPDFKRFCLRGLVDTDGSLIIHKYKSKGKSYVYKKIGFTSRSSPLLKSVSKTLNELNIKHRFGNNFDIRIEAKNDVEKYFNLVDSHNPKHLKRYRI